MSITWTKVGDGLPKNNSIVKIKFGVRRNKSKGGNNFSEKVHKFKKSEGMPRLNDGTEVIEWRYL